MSSNSEVTFVGKVQRPPAFFAPQRPIGRRPSARSLRASWKLPSWPIFNSGFETCPLASNWYHSQPKFETMTTLDTTARTFGQQPSPSSPTPESLARIDLVNIALMVIAGAAAFVVPFELFLFSYAVLGPLHYLTEIGWLHQRSYGAGTRWVALPMFVLGAAASAVYWGWFSDNDFRRTLGLQATTVGIAMALAATIIRPLRFTLPAILLAAFGGYHLAFRLNFGWYRFWVLAMVPTLLHVFVFTLGFLVHGALRSRSRTGAASAFTMVAVGLATLLWRPAFGVDPSAYARRSYDLFAGINQSVLAWFEMGTTSGPPDIFNSSAGISIARFIAFAYTYHYLNWFSKTRVINWHRVPKSQLAIVFAGWIGAVALYAFDYRRGLDVLFFLSYAHVLLELPLNIAVFAGIGRSVVKPSTWKRNSGSLAPSS